MCVQPNLDKNVLNDSVATFTAVFWKTLIEKGIQ